MKNIKYLLILVLQISLLQLSFGQNEDKDGRPLGAEPGPVVKSEQPVIITNIPGDFDDSDVLGSIKNEDTSDFYYPLDLSLINNEIQEAYSLAETTRMINELSAIIRNLKSSYYELRLENKLIRQSINACCSNLLIEPKASDAYLLQNAPNPFYQRSEISYFVPMGFDNVQLSICNIEGEILKVVDIEENGYGFLIVEATTLLSGSYIYALIVNGEIVDSKIMIITGS